MSTKTEHYQLNQYEPGDSFLRTDFNEDNAKIDAALHQLDTDKNAVIVGSYVGDGRDNRFIDLGFTPKAVILCDHNSAMVDSGGNYFGGIVIAGGPIRGFSITEGGFTVRQSDRENLHCNYHNSSYTRTYYYLAVR